MATRCPVCEHMIDNRTIWDSWRGLAGNHQLQCPHCGGALKLTKRSGILGAVVAVGISLAMVPVLQTLRSEGVSVLLIVPLITVVVFLLSVFVYLKLGRYEKATSLSIKPPSIH